MAIKIITLIVTLILMGYVLDGYVLHASTGSLDYRRAHNCWINCEERGLFPGEYHFHLESEQHHDELHREY